MKRSRRWPYLIAAAVLLAAGAWLTSGGEAPKQAPWPRVHMPRRADDDDRDRAKSRVGVKPAPVQPSAVPLAPGAPPPRPTDPMLAALPPQVKEVAVVVEANALRNSDLGESLIDCFTAGSPNTLGRMRDAGFDPLTQLDRISLFDNTLMITGDLKSIDGAGVGAPTESYGDAKLYRRTRTDGRDEVFAVWRGQAALVGETEEIKHAVDRLEGRVASDEQPVLSDADAYGEIYGVLKSDAFAKMFDDTDPRVGELIRSTAESVSVHVDAMHDVGMVADVKGADAQRVDELRRMMGGAIAAARARAMAQGKKEEADVLDLSRILAPKPGSTSFSMELGLPYEMLKAQLDKCVANGKKRQAAREAREATDSGQ